ncbi:MAG: hypothetical protein P8009_09045 [Gammaproteobacteria bacterium]
MLDFGTVHGLTPGQREAVGGGLNALAAPDATALVLAFTPGRRGPLPRGMDRADIEQAYPGWCIDEEIPQAGELPWFLRRLNADPRWYRLSRRAVGAGP